MRVRHSSALSHSSTNSKNIFTSKTHKINIHPIQHIVKKDITSLDCLDDEMILNLSAATNLVPNFHSPEPMQTVHKIKEIPAPTIPAPTIPVPTIKWGTTKSLRALILNNSRTKSKQDNQSKKSKQLEQSKQSIETKQTSKNKVTKPKSRPLPVITTQHDIRSFINSKVTNNVYSYDIPPNRYIKPSTPVETFSEIVDIPNNSAYNHSSHFHNTPRDHVPVRYRFHRGKGLNYTKQDCTLRYHGKPHTAYDPEYTIAKIQKDEIVPTSMEGLCPYCPIPSFYTFRYAGYENHLVLHHGIFPDGYITPDPFKGQFISEAHREVSCPVCNQGVRVLNGRSTAHSTPMLSYFEHFRDQHRSKENSSIPFSLISIKKVVTETGHRNDTG